MKAPVFVDTEAVDTGQLQEIAERIRNRVRRAAEDIISIGQDLTRVKDQLGHGKFLTWIDREFGMTERSARRYMAVGIWAKGKSDTVAGLPFTQMPTLMYRRA